MYKALKTFSGLISMAEGEVREIKDLSIVKDLLNAKYIEEVKEPTKDSKKTVKKTVK